MDRGRASSVAVLLGVVGLVILGGAWAYGNWQASEARVSGIANQLTASMGASAASSPPPTWPAWALGVLGVVVLLGAVALAVGVYVSGNEKTRGPESHTGAGT